MSAPSSFNTLRRQAFGLAQLPQSSGTLHGSPAATSASIPSSFPQNWSFDVPQSQSFVHNQPLSLGASYNFTGAPQQQYNPGFSPSAIPSSFGPTYYTSQQQWMAMYQLQQQQVQQQQLLQLQKLRQGNFPLPSSQRPNFQQQNFQLPSPRPQNFSLSNLQPQTIQQQNSPRANLQPQNFQQRGFLQKDFLQIPNASAVIDVPVFANREVHIQEPAAEPTPVEVAPFTPEAPEAVLIQQRQSPQSPEQEASILTASAVARTVVNRSREKKKREKGEVASKACEACRALKVKCHISGPRGCDACIKGGKTCVLAGQDSRTTADTQKQFRDLINTRRSEANDLLQTLYFLQSSWNGVETVKDFRYLLAIVDLKSAVQIISRRFTPGDLPVLSLPDLFGKADAAATGQGHKLSAVRAARKVFEVEVANYIKELNDAKIAIVSVGPPSTVETDHFVRRALRPENSIYIYEPIQGVQLQQGAVQHAEVAFAAAPAPEPLPEPVVGPFAAPAAEPVAAAAPAPAPAPAPAVLVDVVVDPPFQDNVLEDDELELGPIIEWNRMQDQAELDAMQGVEPADELVDATPQDDTFESDMMEEFNKHDQGESDAMEGVNSADRLVDAPLQNDAFELDMMEEFSRQDMGELDERNDAEDDVESDDFPHDEKLDDLFRDDAESNVLSHNAESDIISDDPEVDSLFRDSESVNLPHDATFDDVLGVEALNNLYVIRL